MLLPVLVADPDSICLRQVVLLYRGQEFIHGGPAEEVVVSVPGPVHGPACNQPPTHKQDQQQSPAADQNRAVTTVADFIKHGSIEQGHRTSSSNLSIREESDGQWKVISTFVLTAKYPRPS